MSEGYRRTRGYGRQATGDSQSKGAGLLPPLSGRPPITRRSAIRHPLSASRSTGMSLVAALFLIVVVSALGAFAVRIGLGQQQTVNLSLLGSRALAAANAGVEWSAAQTLTPAGSCASGSLSLTQGALSGFVVEVTCTETAHTEGSIFVIEAVSHLGAYGQPDYVSRRVRARFFQ